MGLASALLPLLVLPQLPVVLHLLPLPRYFKWTLPFAHVPHFQAPKKEEKKEESEEEDDDMGFGLFD